jgi:hypothetical protein
VHSFSQENTPFQRIPIGTAATLWTNDKGISYILILNQALLFGERLEHSLLCPNQLRNWGHKVNDVLIQYDSKSTHSIHLRSHVPEDEEIVIPLKIRGVISYFFSTYPSDSDLEEYPHIYLTSPHEWNPNGTHLEEQERLAIARISAVTVDGEKFAHTGIAEIPYDPISDDISFSNLLEPADRFESDDDDELSVTFEPSDDPLVNATLEEEGYVRRSTGDPESEFIDAEDLADRLVATIRTNTGTATWNDDLGEIVENPIQQTIHRTVKSVSSKSRALDITPEVLARRWGIGHELAARTLKVTSMKGVRNYDNALSKRFSTKLPYLSYPMMRGTRFYTDTMFSGIKSIRSNECAQVWTNGEGFCLFYPMRSKSEAPETIWQTVQSLQGIPEVLITDNAAEQTSLKWTEQTNSYKITCKTVEPYSPWQNKAESEIRELKRMIKLHMYRSKCPKRFWCYCGEWTAAIRRFTAHNMPGLDGTNPYETIYARTADISEYVQFDWYQYVWYLEPAQLANGVKTRKAIGRWLGVATNTGSKMCYRILNAKGQILLRSSVIPVKPEEKLRDEVMIRIKEHDTNIERKFGNDLTNKEVTTNIGNVPGIEYFLFDDDLEDDPVEPEFITPDEEVPPEQDAFDKYLTANVLLERQGDPVRGTVMARAKDTRGRPIGVANDNPLLDTREYVIEYEDGTMDVLTSNLIAESMYSRINADGHELMLLREIMDHKFDKDLLSKDDMVIPGSQSVRKQTKGCKLLVGWKDGTTSWLPLSEMKNSYPVEVAEYAVNNKIASESCFCWWVPHTIKKRDRIIKKVKTRIFKKTHKFGIEIPRSVAHALEIDARTGTKFWEDAMNKEMQNVRPACDIRDDGIIPAFHKEIKCHMIFDIKADTLQRKARFVAGGHMTDPPKEATYSSVVSRDSIRLFFLIAALNNLQVSACDVQNAYINAPTKEKVWFRAGLELGEKDKGKVVVIIRALYGLKSSGARFREHLANVLREMRFESSRGDPDVWMRKAEKPNGEPIYEYVCCYVDDILYGGLDSALFMKQLGYLYTLKAGSVKEPDKYLGADISKVTVTHDEGDFECYSMSSDSYLKHAIAEVERTLAAKEKPLELRKARVETPMSSGYRPELDDTPFLGPEDANYYMSLMGILRWAIELGRVDIMVEAGLLSRYQAAPREGHLEQMYHIMAYLKKNPKSRIVFDYSRPNFGHINNEPKDWHEYYHGAAEPIPPNMPEPRGHAVSTTAFVDADHGGCQLTRRSHTGVVIYVNRAPILWYSKRQATVESSTFGSESVAMRQAIDMIEGLRYKLRMMGVPIDGATQVFGDNDAVIKSTTRPESTLKKKHNAINYHRIREAVAAGHIIITWCESGHNIADVLTKLLPGTKKRELIKHICFQ